jgi:hypothetical protein
MTSKTESKHEGEHGDHPQPDEKNIFFFYIAEKIDASQPILTGMQIKQTIKARIESFDISHNLILEGQGTEEDLVIGDQEDVVLEHGHGEGPKHFYSKPQTNFGA